MRVFIGSPFKGLVRVRRALHHALASEHEVFWMEDFGSQEVDPLEACLRLIDDVDVYVLLFGSKYGTLLPGSEYSYTYLEYDRAEQTGTPVLAYVKRLKENQSRDARSEDFLQQVKSSHLVEHKEFSSSKELNKMVLRDLERLRNRLLRPKFRKRAAPVADEEAYALGGVRKKVLKSAPFQTTLVDAGAVRDKQYRPNKRGHIGDKVIRIAKAADEPGAPVTIFNDFPVKGKGDLVKLKAERTNKNARLIVIFVPQKTTLGIINHFDNATGERAVFHGDWFEVADGDYYVEAYSTQELKACDLTGTVVEYIDMRVTAHVVAQYT